MIRAEKIRVETDEGRYILAVTTESGNNIEIDIHDCVLAWLLDREGETGQKWLLVPWQPSARNVTDAARTLAKSKTTKEKT